MSFTIYIILIVLILLIIYLILLTNKEDEVIQLINDIYKGYGIVDSIVFENFVTEKGKTVNNSLVQNEITAMSNPDILVSNIKPCNTLNYPLSQYAIKSSFNSAVSGKYVSTDAIKYVLKRGCRLLDFEVFIDENGGASPANPQIAIVSHTNDTISKITNTNTVKLNSINTLNLDDVLSTCISNAFSANNAPNYSDPLFIQLRLKTGKSSLEPILNSIKYALLPKLYMDKNNTAIDVDSNTILNDINGKIILVVDAGLVDISLIKPYINILSNTNKWKNYYYRSIYSIATNPPSITINTKLDMTTDVKDLFMLSPSSSYDEQIPSPFSVFAEYGIQTLLVPFYSINNSNLIIYEKLFNTIKGGIVPFSTIISYSNDIINKTSNYDSSTLMIEKQKRTNGENAAKIAKG